MSCVAIFFNCALAHCVNVSFSGDRPTLACGLKHAAARLPRIAAWAAISMTAGLLLGAIERRASLFGRLTTWIFGFAWSAVTYLVVPVLIAEDRGALASVRRAAELARTTWTKQMVAELRFAWRTLLLFLPAVVLFAAGMNGFPPALPAGVVYAAVCLSAISAARGVFEVALYRYAALGETPRDWSPRMSGMLR